MPIFLGRKCLCTLHVALFQKLEEPPGVFLFLVLSLFKNHGDLHPAHHTWYITHHRILVITTSFPRRREPILRGLALRAWIRQPMGDAATRRVVTSLEFSWIAKEGITRLRGDDFYRVRD